MREPAIHDAFVVVLVATAEATGLSLNEPLDALPSLLPIRTLFCVDELRRVLLCGSSRDALTEGDRLPLPRGELRHKEREALNDCR